MTVKLGIMSQKRKRNSYDVRYKLEVIEFAQQSSNCAAERKYGVSEKMVRDWRSKEEKIRNASSKSVKKLRTVLSPYDDLEMKLKDWIIELRSNGYIVTRPTVRLRALQLAKDFGHPEFKASAGWCTRFFNRNGLTLRQRTHIAQKLPKDIETKVTSFQKFVIDLRKGHEFELGNIGNMDETPMFFDMPGSRTVDIKGSKTVTVKTTGSDKSHFTVILACLANGTKLKPAVIFKRKTMPKDKFPSGVIVYVQEKGWVDENVLLKWLNDVWFKRPGALLNAKSVMVWDMFRAHLVDSVKRKLKERKTYQVVIPGGCTSVLQPLDVCLNKPFKVNMRHKWNTWMVEGTKHLTKQGNLKRPELTTVCQWVVDSWNEIPSDMVMRSFLKCGISNSLDGMQDDELFSEFIGDHQESACESEDLTTSEYDAGIYDDCVSESQFNQLFGESDDEDFDGF